MIRLPKLVEVTDLRRFERLLKQELEKLDGVQLPLQRALTRSSYTNDDDFSVTVLGVRHNADGVVAKVGVQYKGIVAGCSCADDPTPIPQIDEYCELVLTIDPRTGDAHVALCT